MYSYLNNLQIKEPYTISTQMLIFHSPLKYFYVFICILVKLEQYPFDKILNNKIQAYMMKIVLFLLVLVVVALSRTYPMYKQCDPAWKNDQLGTSSNTICSAGCLMSSVAMAMTATVKNFTPANLNKWLTQNRGYESGDLFVWESVNTFGITFQGKFPNSAIKAKLDQGCIILCNVHNGKHWVLAYGYVNDNILINDPNYTVQSYSLSQIVDGQNGVYTVPSGEHYNILQKLKALNNKG